MEYQDYYQILGVNREASEADIKKAYRRLARKYHPDVSKEPGAEERFKNISMAYEVLGNPEKRSAYDQLGRHAPGQDFRPPPDWEQRYGAAGDFSEMNFSDLFEQILGGMNAGRGRRTSGVGRETYERAHQPDLTAETHISLEEAFSGTERMIDWQGERLRVRIPKGCQDGEKLRVPIRARKGWARLGGGGNLQITVRVDAHPPYQFVGERLEMELVLTPPEAVLGTEVEIQTLHGRVRLKIPPGTDSGKVLRLDHKGMPQKGGGFGALFVRIRIASPRALTEHEQTLYRELLKIQGRGPRNG
jgi:curved DNA-binding protein